MFRVAADGQRTRPTPDLCDMTHWLGFLFKDRRDITKEDMK